MGSRWSLGEENILRTEMSKLYVGENKSISEIAGILSISEKTVYKRLKRLGIKTSPERKSGYRNKRIGVKIPSEINPTLAEFLGIMLGDGQLTHFQIKVTLGSKELEYVQYVSSLMNSLFNVDSSVCVRKTGYRDVYFGSVDVSDWLFNLGLKKNKVDEQVDIPECVISKRNVYKDFIRGFFDTDGSVYALKYGIQISFTNFSIPFLQSLRKMLIELEYKPSKISCNKVYLTNKDDVARFFTDVIPKNQKHIKRFERICAGVRVVK